MCGICGIINLNLKPVEESKLHLMMGAMKHRGPDDEGVFIKENIGFGFVRLSILDLSKAGHQPMVSKDRRYIIVLNGEIFNYIEIRERLKSTYNFISNTDTEVLLAAYITWGKQCLDILNGMFAFIILDTITNELFGARDRFGIKPFYYYCDSEVFLFASDIPPLLKVIKPKIMQEDSIIFDYLVLNRTNHIEKTFFKGILKLLHGHSIALSEGVLVLNRWYNLGSKIKNSSDSTFTDEEFLYELSKSVKLQLRCDVPVGTCLSGGLDSSAITSLVLAQNSDKRLHSFSAVYGKGQRGDESEYIDEYLNRPLDIHYTHPTSYSLFNDLNAFISSQTEPVPSTSIYAEYKVMELAKDYCTVLLNGQGADEILAGYHYFYGYYFRDLLKEFKWSKFLNEIYKYSIYQKSNIGFKYLIFSFYPKSLRLFKNHHHLDGGFYNHYYHSDNVLFESFYQSKNLKEFLINHFEYKFEHHLMWADKTGMQFSLETRFPFLDHNLVEKTLSLDSENYIKNGYTKAIMRNALKGIIPEKIRIRRDKVGFSTPENEWFLDRKLLNLLKGIINSQSFQGRGYFNVKNCQLMVENFERTRKTDLNFWKWVHLELWFQKYID